MMSKLKYPDYDAIVEYLSKNSPQLLEVSQLQWGIQQGSIVNKGQIIGQITIPFVSKAKGCVQAIPKALTDKLQVACMHDMLYGKICMDCKEVIDSPAESYATSSLVNPKVLIRETTAKMLETGMKNSILSENKLILVLDLDNTLIHATTNPAYSMTVPGLNSEYFEVNISGSTFYVKLRPNLHDFLQALSCYYKIYIFTAATKPYALAILQIIDPTSSIILPNNIITREELKEGKKDMSLILPYDYSLTIIVDDRVDSWSANSNILRVQS